jgi:alginate O-acetyltransferase complex protein AlgI
VIFSSFRFLIFFPIVLILYYASRRLRYRQTVLLIASYIFYASWDYRFLSLIFISTLVDYITGLRIPRAATFARKRWWLALSICVNLGLLGYFKYANFFIDSFQGLLTGLGFDASPRVLDIILPVGISFYTFQTMSYSLDVYRGKIESNKNFLEFALFVACFPQLVAGPIVRAVELLPQIKRHVTIRWVDISEGMNRFLQGFTKKILIADNIAYFVDRVFKDPAYFDGATLWAGSIAFAVQVYCDFSGYSDMAIGTARMLGFRLPENFRFPFTSLNVSDFWRRWHITLYSFMRDYLYISLGGSRVKPGRLIFNVVLTMTLVGFWHGADWQFLLWGFYNGVLIVVYRIIKGWVDRIALFRNFLATLAGKIFLVALNNILFFIGLAIFRCLDVRLSVESVWRMLTFDGTGTRFIDPWVLIFYAAVLLSNIACEFNLFGRMARRTPLPLQYAGYLLLIVILVLFGAHDTQAFVYFQF